MSGSSQDWKLTTISMQRATRHRRKNGLRDRRENLLRSRDSGPNRRTRFDVKSMQMRMALSGILRRFLAIAASTAILSGLAGCSYLQWRRSRAAVREQLKRNPADLALARDYAPQDCYGLVGRISVPSHPHALLAAAFNHGRATELVGWASVDPKRGYYAIMSAIAYCARRAGHRRPGSRPDHIPLAWAPTGSRLPRTAAHSRVA